MPGEKKKNSPNHIWCPVKLKDKIRWCQLKDKIRWHWFPQQSVDSNFGQFSNFINNGLAVRVFANGPGDLGSIPGRVIPKTQKMVLDASLLNTQHYKVWIKGKVGQSREGVAPSPTPWCSSYRKGSLRVTLNYGRQLFFFYQ